MGQDKALLAIAGSEMTSIVAVALVEAGAREVLTVGGDLAALSCLSGVNRSVPDDDPGEGPLAGILTAMRYAIDDVIVVLACDTPAITSAAPLALVAALLTEPAAGVAYAEVEGRVQPLTAAWRISRSWEVVSKAFAEGERAPRAVFTSLDGVAVKDVLASAVDDVDHPSDLRRYAADPLRSSTPNEDSR
jgi:molybdopterin-guanine dinucleotide biosynthesis protein A